MGTCFTTCLPSLCSLFGRGSDELGEPQSKRSVAGDMFEVRVGTQEFRVGVETRLGDNAVHRAANGDSFSSQGPEHAGGSHVALHRWVDHGKRDENTLGSLKARVGSKSLKDLCDDDGNDGQVILLVKSNLEALRMGTLDSVEEIRPSV